MVALDGFFLSKIKTSMSIWVDLTGITRIGQIKMNPITAILSDMEAEAKTEVEDGPLRDGPRRDQEKQGDRLVVILRPEVPHQVEDATAIRTCTTHQITIMSHTIVGVIINQKRCIIMMSMNTMNTLLRPWMIGHQRDSAIILLIAATSLTKILNGMLGISPKIEGMHITGRSLLALLGMPQHPDSRRRQDPGSTKTRSALPDLKTLGIRNPVSRPVRYRMRLPCQLTVVPATDRIVQASIMPNTVAWDNPFPTFPLRPRPAEHANPTNLNGSTGSERVRDEPQQDNTFDNRSQTAIGGTGNYVVSPTGKDKLGRGDSRYQPDNPPSVMLEGNANSKGEGYFDAQPQSGRDAAQYQGTTQDKPRVRENGRWGPRVDQLKPISSDRHSEDNRTRPSFVFGNRMDVSYERSKTMPITLSEAALKHGHQMDQPVWQEPGFVAGYHGPEDRGFTRNSPVNGFRQGLSIQSSAHVDQPRPPQVNPVVHAQSTDTPAPHAQKDSLGDFFDTYYGASPDDHQPYLYNKDRQHRLPADEPIPHFDYPMPPLSDARRQGLAIDTHLQPQPRNQGFSPVPLHLREDVRRDHSYDPHSDSRHPRSRSQPNLEEQRSPKPPANDGFDFGVPGSPNRPTTTALVRNEHVFSADSAPTFLGTSLDQYHSDRQKRGRTPPDVYRYNDYNVPKLLAPGPGQAAMTNQGNGSNDQHHPLPTQSGRPRQMGPLSGRLSPIVNQARPISPPTMSPANPDALPSHPAPIRPGLTQIGPMNQASKPVPLRQYNLNPSTTQPSSPIKAPGPPPSVSAISESIPVTHQELERLKQATAKNPEDPKTQLLLAKKMVEAASVLIDERLDPRTRSKSREKYILDAYKIIKKLSNNGYSEATFFLADAYSRGSLGLEPDNREAFKLYQSAAKAGHAQAAYRVAVCCEIGHEEGGGTSRDAVKAMQWYKRAATLGDTPAMYKMGIISLKGLLGQPKNPKEAVIWLKRAADRADEENPHALHELVSSVIQAKTAGVDGG